MSLLCAVGPIPLLAQTPKVTVRLGQAVYWTTEGNDVVWLVVGRGNDVAQEPFTVQYATSDLTAKAGLDYETAAGVLSFALGETNKTVAIKIFNDELQENEETFRVKLGNNNANNAVRLAHGADSVWRATATGCSSPLLLPGDSLAVLAVESETQP